jgi:anti-sigma factor RsiW
MEALKLQAYLDHELSAAEAAEVAAWVAKDAQAAALLGELKLAKTALAGNELEVAVPESRDFYWSKIAREIERSEQLEETAKPLPWWRRLAMPLGFAAVAAVIAVSVVMTRPAATNNQVANDASTYSFYDEDGDVTVVWVSGSGMVNGN